MSDQETNDQAPPDAGDEPTPGTDPGTDTATSDVPATAADDVPEDFKLELAPTGASGYTLDDIERLSHNEHLGGYQTWAQAPQWHARKQERILRQYLIETWENLGGETGNVQAQQAIRSAIESGLHALAAIADGQHAKNTDITAAP